VVIEAIPIWEEETAIIAFYRSSPLAWIFFPIAIAKLAGIYAFSIVRPAVSRPLTV
jgi:hypothetical protein